MHKHFITENDGNRTVLKGEIGKCIQSSIEKRSNLYVEYPLLKTSFDHILQPMTAAYNGVELSGRRSEHDRTGQGMILCNRMGQSTIKT